MAFSDVLHLTGKGAAVLGCEFVRVFDEGTGTVQGTSRENVKGCK